MSSVKGGHFLSASMCQDRMYGPQEITFNFEELILLRYGLNSFFLTQGVFMNDT